MPLDEQKQLIDGMRDAIDPPGDGNGPPEGVDAEVVGLPVLAADANTALSSNRYLLSAIGLLAVALALLAVYRTARRALVPLIPIVFATGWSALVVELAGIPLNPMSATLGALVIAIATEFSVLLSARFEEERGGGRSLGESLRRAYSRTGVAVMASGRDRDRRLRRPDRHRHPDAARLRPRHRARSRGRPRRRADRPAGRARVGRGPASLRSRQLARRLRPRRRDRSSAATG